MYGIRVEFLGPLGVRVEDSIIWGSNGLNDEDKAPRSSGLWQSPFGCRLPPQLSSQPHAHGPGLVIAILELN